VNSISALAKSLWGLLLSLTLVVSTTTSAVEIVLQSTTSTANSGLYEAILPAFTADTGITVHVVSVGTGQAIKNAKNGDGDVLLVHAKAAEEAFVDSGYGVERFDVMYNDFVIVGPTSDPAGIAGMDDATSALGLIAQAGAVFLSRGDDSGTHQKEVSLWEASTVDPTPKSGTWYRETGQGMGSTLNIAIGMGGYSLTDRGTWISFNNRGNHKVLVEGDVELFNQYGVILVNPKRHQNVEAEAGQAFIDWLLRDQGQTAIANHKINGQQLFYPNARK
jgi:tungstate transport system substrate-binding protein